MRFRFLYLDKNGDETKVESLDELRQRVADREIDEDTLLYDARTREWSPARVHTAYRSVAAELEPPETDGAPATDSAADASETGGEGTDEMPGLAAGGMELTDAVPDTVARFLERRQRERREEDERRATAFDDLNVVDESTRWQSDRAPEAASDGAPSSSSELEHPTEPASSSDADAHPAASSGSADVRKPPESGRSRTSEEPSRPEARPVTVRVNATGGRARRRRRTWGLVAAGAAAIALFAVRGWGGSARAGEIVQPAQPGPPPAANPELEARLRDAEGSAFQDMITAMDSLRTVFDVVGAPREWLTGRYLASASEFPDVAQYWVRYQAYVGELRNRDEELFRRGFVQRLESTGIDGPVRSMRLARATEEFAAEAPAREELYAAMQGMARVALELHELLVQNEASIVYTPVRPGVVTQDPVLEAVPTDAELRERLWDTLDSLFLQVDIVRGGVPGSGDQLGEAALEGIRATTDRRQP
jgi:hypothetical protein